MSQAEGAGTHFQPQPGQLGAPTDKLVAFLALLLLSSPSAVPACCKPQQLCLAHGWNSPGGFVPALELPSLVPGAGSRLSQEALAEGRAGVSRVGGGFVLLMQLLA